MPMNEMGFYKDGERMWKESERGMRKKHEETTLKTWDVEGKE